jgi:hypothetical protein
MFMLWCLHRETEQRKHRFLGIVKDMISVTTALIDDLTVFGDSVPAWAKIREELADYRNTMVAMHEDISYTRFVTRSIAQIEHRIAALYTPPTNTM